MRRLISEIKISALLVGLFVMEAIMPRKAMSKIVDPQALVIGNVKYQSHANYVEAIDITSEKTLWHTVLYPTIEPEHPDPTLEQDAQWNIISAIKIIGDQIEARDRNGNIYELNRMTGRMVKKSRAPTKMPKRTDK